MDRRSIERIRNADFAHAVRGYDRNEVDAFLKDLADWLATGGADNAGAETVRAELERVGERTAGVLTEAHEAAEAIREDAARDVRQKLVDANVTTESLRSSAEEHSERTREDADAYARKTRADADAYAEHSKAESESAAEDSRKEAEAEAERIVDEANQRRAAVETRIAELEKRRDGVLHELDRLASGITGTATLHRGSLGEEGEETPGDGDGEPGGAVSEGENATGAGGDDEAETKPQPVARSKDTE